MTAQKQATQEQPEPTTDEFLKEVKPVTDFMDKFIEYVPFMGKEPIKLNAKIVLRYFAAPTKKGFVPTEQQATKFVMLCQARGLNPWEGDAFLVGYDASDGAVFNLITAHQAFLKRAEVHPEYNGMESGVTVKRKAKGDDGKEVQETIDLPGDYFEDTDHIVGGWARVHFKTREVPTYRRIKLTTFNTGYSRWKADPGGMICKVAEADALRSSFPNSLGGMYLEGEFSGNEEPSTNGQPHEDHRAKAKRERTEAASARMAPAKEENPEPEPAVEGAA